MYIRGQLCLTIAMLAAEERAAAEAIVALGLHYPYVAEREGLVLIALSEDYRAGDPEHNARRRAVRAQYLLERAHAALSAGAERDSECTRLYEGLLRVVLQSKFEPMFRSLAQACQSAGLMLRRVASYEQFVKDAEPWLALPGEPLGLRTGLPHLFAFLFQIRRAAMLIEGQPLLGRSRAADEVRAALWRAVFSRDLARYERMLYRQMHRLPVLVVGPRGTLKEEVARIVGLCGYVPFDAERLRFTSEPAMSLRHWDARTGLPGQAELVPAPRGQGADESEPVREPAVGAGVSRHDCWVLGEVDRLDSTQQSHLVERLEGLLGRGEPGRGPGLGPRMIAVSDEELETAMTAGTFREDLYFFLSAHRVELPALATELRQHPDDLTFYVSQALAPLLEGSELRAATEEVVQYIERKLPQHVFPGNQRELAHCARAILMGGDYRPKSRPVEAADAVLSGLAQRFISGDFDMDGLLDAYCTLMYGRTGSYQESARRLGIDRRTVKSRVNAALLAELS